MRVLLHLLWQLLIVPAAAAQLVLESTSTWAVLVSSIIVLPAR